ncbi:hypothetical protein Tco_0178725 [Tanacetum coccineum]
MTLADELLLNGQIRPMRLSSHLQCPQDAMTLDDGEGICRDFTARERRRRARSISQLRSTGAWLVESNEIDEDLKEEEEAHAPSSGASSRSSSSDETRSGPVSSIATLDTDASKYKLHEKDLKNEWHRY